MKNLSLFSLLVMTGLVLFIGGCAKDEVLIQHNDTTQFRSNSIWEFEYIYNLMKSMESSDLVNFLNNSGSPSWAHSVQKRDDGIKITSIPIILANKVNGVIKLYELNSDSIYVKYFEKSALDSIILRTDLDAEEFEVYKGAIQSLILTTYNYDQTFEEKYLNWLIATKNRVAPRVAWHCIEVWECHEIYTSETTWTSFSDRKSFVFAGAHLGEGWDCILLTRECWVDFTPRNFPSSTFKSGPGKTNPPIITGGGSSGSGNLTIENAKKEYLTQLLNYKGLNEKYGIIISECIGALVIPEYSQSGLIDVVIDMKCYEAKLNQIAKDLGLTEECIKNASIDLIIKLINVADYIDPCTGEPVDKSMIYNKFCQNASKGESALDDALDGVDYIAFSSNQFASCPKMQCLIANLIKGNISDNLSNRICSVFQPNSNPRGLHFVNNIPSFNSQPDALAGAVVEKTQIGKLHHTIYINGNKCNTHTDPLKNLTTIQHELIHVDIHKKLLDKYGWDGVDANMQGPFNAFIAAEYPGKNYANHHQLFIGEYLTEMLNGIKSANGGLGLPPPNETDIYLGIVLDAFPDELAFISTTLGYTKSDIDKFVKNFNTWIQEKGPTGALINQSPTGIYSKCP